MKNSNDKKKFSHPCVKEGAKAEKYRRDNSTPISKEFFLSVVDNAVFNELHESVTIRSNATYHQSFDAVYVDNGDMDYIFI
ncbi:hypothetical protein [Psychromonas sp. SP041]|uniref:hypothetical protein n=1 Tax=Psychromonas sp. SP041 TaxID=1365007 RepID=UPI0010C7D7FD|nr:hypothetical protein [Psychromonas sp. SP041]